MDKVIHSERFHIHPSEPEAEKQWKLWYRNFVNFLSTIKDHPLKMLVIMRVVNSDISRKCARAVQLLPRPLFYQPPV